MVKTIKEERLRWVLPIVRKEFKLKDAAKVCPHSKRGLERWVALYKTKGAAGLSITPLAYNTPAAIGMATIL